MPACHSQAPALKKRTRQRASCDDGAGDGNRTHAFGLEGRRSTIEPHPQMLWLLPACRKCPIRHNGAGDGNRTHIAGLGSRCSTTELHPRLAAAPLVKRAFPPASDGNDILPMERKTRFELATFALARRRSTTEPLPLVLNPCPPVGQKEQASATAMLRSVRTKRATGRLATWCGRKDSNLHAWGTRT